MMLLSSSSWASVTILYPASDIASSKTSWSGNFRKWVVYIATEGRDLCDFKLKKNLLRDKRLKLGVCKHSVIYA